MAAGVDASKNTRDGIGINIEWDVTNRLRLELDYHDSTAEQEPSVYGSSAVSMSAFGRNSASVNTA